MDIQAIQSYLRDRIAQEDIDRDVFIEFLSDSDRSM